MIPTPSPRRHGPDGSACRRGPGRGGLSIVLVLALVLPAAGCATKGDLKDLRAEVRSRAATQDTLLARIARISSTALDSLRAHREEFLHFRGDFGRQLLAIEDQLVQIQELTGQSQRRIAELRDQMEARSREMLPPRPDFSRDTTGGEGAGERGEAGGGEAGPPGEAAAGSDPEAAFNASLQQLRRGSLSTARRGFEEFLRAFGDHELAPHARFYHAETLERENRLQEALDAFLRIPELHPASRRVPDALYRAGRIEQQRGNTDAAKRHFERVVDGYPDSDAAGLARERLEEIG